MRIYLIVLALGVSIFGVQPGKAATDASLAKMDGDTVARFHFAGTDRVAADPVPVELNKIGAMPVTQALRDKVLTSLSSAPFRILRSRIAGQSANDHAPLIRPLLDDLLRCESYAEMRGPTNAVPEFMLAVLLTNDRAKIWKSNLSIVLADWTGIPVTEIHGPGFTGWELKKHKDPELVRCLRVGDWLLFGWGSGELRLQPGFVQRIKDNKRPVEAAREDLLDVLVDWPTLTAYHPIKLPSPLPAGLPRMHLMVAARKDYLRPKLVMQYKDALGLNLEQWRIPTNIIHNPIVSFTAARGIAPWLSQLPEVKELQPGIVPNQAAIWSMDGLPFGTRMVIPVADSSNYLAAVAPRLTSVVNAWLMNHEMSSAATITNNRIGLVGGTPFVSPYLWAIHEPKDEYLLGGLFPILPRTNEPPVPTELIHIIMSEPKLVYYGWELNAARILQWKALSEVYLMSSDHLLPPATSAGVKWLHTVGTNLGNCQTEITLTAPNELTLVRSAPIGLTGLEMTALEYWIDAPGFPLEATYPKRPLRPPKLAPPK